MMDQKINFLPCLVNHKLNKEIPTYHLDNETKAKKNMFSHYNLFLKGLFKSNIFLNYLEKNNLTNNFKLHLDIGGREAGVGAILKTIGSVKSSTTTDVIQSPGKI